MKIGNYRPGTALRKLRSPTHMILCDQDTVAPVDASLAMLKHAGPNVEVKRYPMGHFDIHVDAGFERALADQLAFFGQHIPVVSALPPSA